MTTAQTIIDQLGGNKFAAMTGAKNFVDVGDGVQFDLPRGAANKATKVRVMLNVNDTYTMVFYKWRGVDLKPISGHTDVFADQLCDTFENATGLACKL